MKLPGTRPRFTAQSVLRLVCVLSFAWALWLMVAGGVDWLVFGVRIRSTDPIDPLFIGLAALATLTFLRWRARRLAERAIHGVVPWSTRIRSALPIAGILAVAAVTRFWAIGFGLPNPNCRPDEGAVAAVAGYIYSGHLVAGVYNYPSFFMIAIATAMWIVTRRVPALLGRFGVHPSIGSINTLLERITARLLSAAAGVATVWVLFRTATRLFDRQIALASAALLALAFLHVRDSHFGVTDIPMTFMIVLAFSRIVRLWESGAWRDLIVAGIVSGVAMATKYNALLLIVPASWAIVSGSGGHSPGHRVLRVVAFGGLMLAAFLVVCPGAIFDHQRFIADVMHESRHLAEGHGVDLGRGWIYHLTTTLRYGVGIPMLIAAAAGASMLLYRTPRKGILIAAFPATYYALSGSGLTVFARYMLPMIPFLCLTAGYAVCEVASAAATYVRRPHWASALATIGVLGVLWPSARSVVQFDRLLQRPDSRLVARQWIEARFPAGTTIAQLGPEGSYVFHNEPQEIQYRTVTSVEAGTEPRVVIVPSSPLLRDAPAVEEMSVLERNYDLVLSLNVAEDVPANVYDRQDEFYLPIAGFKGIERPGPNFRVYVRR